ncbi:MAG: hypothetical protein HY290_03765 [Planctomycetia bacterium]|nr:hypothetical protein [Planctomycetia bacterium]
MPQPGTSFYEDFYPRGVRKFVAIGVICVTTLVPSVVAWKDGAGAVPQQSPAFGSRFGIPGRGGNAPSPRPGIPWSRIGRMLLSAFGGALGLAIYYPRWGFKRYALLCGPILGIGSIVVAEWYLTGRTRVYRFETVFTSLIGGLPGVVLYVLLARRKWRKKQPADTIWIE